MRRSLRTGVRPPGGIVSYPLERVFKEVAFLAYHFHWSKETLLDMTHRERHVWVREVSEINGKINKSRGG
ncbi:MAG: DUF6760 family protein [Myxococcota bacterium]